MKSILKSTLVIILFIGCIGFVLMSGDQLVRKNHIWSDQEGYYLYLPALMIYGDFKELPIRSKKVFEFENQNGEKYVYTKYTYGVALMQLPFFLIVHLFQKVFNPLEATGYSMAYSQMIWIAALAYVLCSLWMLYRILRHNWSAGISAITTGLLFFGTNLLHYTIGEPGMSHAYSFFLLTLLLTLTEKQLKHPDKRWLVFWIILILSLIFLIRPVNVIVAIYPLFRLWHVYWGKLRSNGIFIINALLLAGLLIFLQLVLWKEMTGSWTWYSYMHEPGFIYWTRPRLLSVLISIENGWFIYTPLAMFMILGLVSGLAKFKKQFISIGMIFCVIWYISSSWWKWNFGMAFGYRPFIEYYALLALPLAYILDRIYSWKNRFPRIATSIILILLVFINIGLTDRYGAPWEGESWNWNSFLTILKSVFLFQ
jgi:hypothetical protein